MGDTPERVGKSLHMAPLRSGGALHYLERMLHTRTAMTWYESLAAPDPGRHIAQLYTDAGFLVRAVTRFAAEGLARGEGVVIIATPLHLRAVTDRLLDHHLDVDALRRRGALVSVDAVECLTGLLVGGMPDKERFRASVGRILEEMTGRGFARIRAFGEMVDLLRPCSVEAALRLEALWDEVLLVHGVSLLCGYSIDNFDPHAHRALVPRVAQAHSDLIPVEDYDRLERAVRRAYQDVFGEGGDGDTLRRMFIRHYDAPAAMPDGQAAILAAMAFVPTAGELLVDRAARYYTALAENSPPEPVRAPH